MAKFVRGDLWGIVMVATEAGQALRDYGACASLPPAVIRRHTGWEVYRSFHPFEVHPIGLPVWWENKVVPDGWWRAWCVWTNGSPERLAPCPTQPTLEEVIDLTNKLETAGLCRAAWISGSSKMEVRRVD